MWTINGDADDFLIQQTANAIIVGGIIENQPGNAAKHVTIVNDIRISMRKGPSHHWTKYSEDCALAYQTRTKKIIAVFDGVSGPMDGSGGKAARQAAERLLKKVRTITKKNYKNVLDEWNTECNDLRATTALVFLRFDNQNILLNKGDCVCFVNGKPLNKRHGEGNIVTRVLGDPQPFDEYDVPDGEIRLCSDGIFNERDDVTEIVIA